MQRHLGRERGAFPGGSAAGFVELTELRAIRKNPDIVSGGWPTWRACVTADQTLHEWNSGLQAGGRGAVQDGYFATREEGGKVSGQLHASWEIRVT